MKSQYPCIQHIQYRAYISSVTCVYCATSAAGSGAWRHCDCPGQLCNPYHSTPLHLPIAPAKPPSVSRTTRATLHSTTFVTACLCGRDATRNPSAQPAEPLPPLSRKRHRESRTRVSSLVRWRDWTLRLSRRLLLRGRGRLQTSHTRAPPVPDAPQTPLNCHHRLLL